MTMENTISNTTGDLNDTAVEQYLQKHPDFLHRHAELLDHIDIPHASGNAVSLVEKQVSILRERNIDMRHRLAVLTENARRNDLLYEQTRALTLKLLEANTLSDLHNIFKASMAQDFEVEFCTMILFGDAMLASDDLRMDTAERARNEVGALLRNRKPLCGALRQEELGYLFPDTGNVASAAVMPILTEYNELGIIAVGSSDASRYDSNMGTLFLTYIADVLARLIPSMER